MVAENLDKPVQFLKGVGPARAKLLERLDIHTLADLLLYFPREWQERRETRLLGPPTASSDIVVIKGRVLTARQLRAGQSLAIYKATIATGENHVQAVWFKRLSRRFDVFAALKKEVAAGAELWLVGKSAPELLGVHELRVDEHYIVADGRWRLHVDRLVPIYPLTEGIGQRLLRELTHAALVACESAPDIIPLRLRQRRGLIPAAQALRGIHFPDSAAELDAARTRLAYEELLLLELAWVLKRRQTRKLHKDFRYELKRTLLTPFKEALGFPLTAAQKRVINEIFRDMDKPRPMTRLLQGDVGSGKTVVALSALLLAVENGFQGALMAPTEILAEQHFATLTRFLKNLPVRIGLLTSSADKIARAKILQAAGAGELDILVGTHALLEEDVRFPRLRLAVIDEQHRFGVRQRATLRQKGALLDLLIMTATPIPRTLALALYGDLDVSTIDEMPPGKAAIKTLAANNEDEALAAVREEAALGRQSYIVYPIIEESAATDLRSAKAEYERLRAGPLKNLRVALLHGAMTGKQKAATMDEFARGAVDVLVATQVIEVGIDVPRATVMVIQNADRFGLASLHQLRGRIGRGEHDSRCFLIASPKTPAARARLEILLASRDGFRIGEEDLKLRGPGEFLGTAQHGALTLRIADILRDAALLTAARADGEELLMADPKLLNPENAGLRERLISLYQRRWKWIDLA